MTKQDHQRIAKSVLGQLWLKNSDWIFPVKTSALTVGVQINGGKS